MAVVPRRLELRTSTLSVWRSNQLSYRTGYHRLSVFLLLYLQKQIVRSTRSEGLSTYLDFFFSTLRCLDFSILRLVSSDSRLQKGGVPAAPSGTATLLRLSPNYQFHLRPPLAVTDFRCPRLSWLDGRCVQGPGTYSPRHG